MYLMNCMKVNKNTREEARLTFLKILKNIYFSKKKDKEFSILKRGSLRKHNHHIFKTFV